MQCPIVSGLVDLMLILLHKPSQFLTVVWGSSATCFFYLRWYFATMIPSYPGLPQWFSSMFFLACLFFSSSLWYPDHNLGRLRNSLCGQSGQMTKLQQPFLQTSQFLLFSSASNPSVENAVSLILFLVSVLAYLASSEFWNR